MGKPILCVQQHRGERKGEEERWESDRAWNWSCHIPGSRLFMAANDAEQPGMEELREKGMDRVSILHR